MWLKPYHDVYLSKNSVYNILNKPLIWNRSAHIRKHSFLGVSVTHFSMRKPLQIWKRQMSATTPPTVGTEWISHLCGTELKETFRLIYNFFGVINLLSSKICNSCTSSVVWQRTDLTHLSSISWNLNNQIRLWLSWAFECMEIFSSVHLETIRARNIKGYQVT